MALFQVHIQKISAAVLIFFNKEEPWHTFYLCRRCGKHQYLRNTPRVFKPVRPGGKSWPSWRSWSRNRRCPPWQSLPLLMCVAISGRSESTRHGRWCRHLQVPSMVLTDISAGPYRTFSIATGAGVLCFFIASDTKQNELKLDR